MWVAIWSSQKENMCEDEANTIEIRANTDLYYPGDIT